MKKLKAAFDVDGTLITLDDKPNYKIIDLFKMLETLGFTMYIHSGGGIDYATMWRDKLGLDAIIKPKGDPKLEYDIAVDDAIDEYVWSSKKHKFYINAKVFITVKQYGK